jgi:hypothetical protein
MGMDFETKEKRLLTKEERAARRTRPARRPKSISLLEENRTKLFDQILSG